MTTPHGRRILRSETCRHYIGGAAVLFFARRLDVLRRTRYSLPVARAMFIARALPTAQALFVGGLLALTAGSNAGVASAVLPGAAAWPSFPSPTTPQQQGPDYGDELFQAMRWRNIGPHRGGRSVAVAGVVSDLGTYYFGAAGGGVWKTTDAGETWTNVTDGFLNTGSVGAVEVSIADPNVVYVGMGEHAVRGVANSHGDGVYRSTDAGRTWTHLGLERSRHISRIRIHPNDPDLVYVAVQGQFGPPAPRLPAPRRVIHPPAPFRTRAGSQDSAPDPPRTTMREAGFHGRYQGRFQGPRPWRPGRPPAPSRRVRPPGRRRRGRGRR